MARVESLFTAIVSASARTTIPHTHAAYSAIIIPQYLMTNLKPRTLRGCPSNTLYILYIYLYIHVFLVGNKINETVVVFTTYLYSDTRDTNAAASNSSRSL